MMPFRLKVEVILGSIGVQQAVDQAEAAVCGEPPPTSHVGRTPLLFPRLREGRPHLGDAPYLNSPHAQASGLFLDPIAEH